MERSVPIYKICHIRSPAGIKERSPGGEEGAAGGGARSVSDLTEEYNILYVFFGNVEFLSEEGGVVNINDLFIRERKNPFFKSIFSEYELQSIIHNEIKVVFLPERIYPDDSIETIKKKFLYLTRDKVGLSYAELYLFCKQAKTITSQVCYDQITSNGKLEITPVRIQNFLLNIDNHPRESVNYGSSSGGADALTQEAPDFTKLGAPSESDGNYSYTNILNLKLESQPRFVNVVLGQELSTVSEGYPYSINPFDAIYADPFLEVHAAEIINTTNKTVLIDIGVFLHNTIYLVSAGDALQYAKSLEDPATLAELGIPVNLPPIGAGGSAAASASVPASLLRLITENYIVQLYFPYLAVYRDDTKRLSLELGSAEASGETDLSTIHSHNTLLLHRLKLVESDKKILNERFMRQTANIKLLYDIYEKRTREHAYSDNGIRGVEFHIHQSAKYNLSLDAIFKLIHCSEYIPFIKYNPGKKMDNIYKLYISGVSKSGRKIPYLPKGDIFRLIKTTARKKGVSILIQYTYSNPSIPDHKATHLPIPIICEFDADGSVYVKLFVKYSFTTEEMEDIIRATVNPVMRVVKEYVEQSGFQMNLFTKFTHENIDLINVEYYAQLPIKRNIEIKSMIKCISSAFNEIEGSLNKGIVLRYKRVSNYNDMTSQEAYIIEMMNTRHTDREIIDGLRDNYMMSEEDARVKIVTLLSSIQTQQMSRYRGGSIRIKNNPGFLTKITKGQFNNIITIEISNINNILFLTSLHIYIDSIIRVYQDPSTTDIPYEQIMQLCQGDGGATITKPASGTKSTGAAAGAAGGVRESSGSESSDELDQFIDDTQPQAILRDVNQSDKEESIETMTEIVSLSRKPIPESVTSTILGEKLVFGFEAEESGAGGGGSDAGDAGEGGIDLFDLLQDDDEDEGDQFGGAGGAAKGRPAGGEADDDKLGPRSGPGGEADDSLSDITGLELANPNPFSKRIQERDPIIHLNEDVGKFNAYSRSCPWNVRRQPVILTSEEKARIDREHPNSYSQSITYGSDQSKQYHYICPRYWSLKHNTSLTEEEVKSGKYGKVIPQKAKKVPAGASIFEFTDDKYHLDEKGNYKPHYPGFLKKDAHPKGLCVPCCFGQWDKPSQTARRQECEMKQHEEIRIKEKDKLEESRQLSAPGSGSSSMSAPSSASAVPEVAKITEMKDDRILSSDKFPLDNNRWGYLPVPIQKFLFSDSRNCQVSLKNTAIKKDTPCLLRRGVETNDKQSFLSVVAYYFKESVGSIKTTVSDITTEVTGAMTTTSVASHKSIDDIITGASAAVAGGGGGAAGGGGLTLKEMISKSVTESINKQSAQIRSGASTSAPTPRSSATATAAATIPPSSSPGEEEGYHSEGETPVAMTPRAYAVAPVAPTTNAVTTAGAVMAAFNTGDTVPSIREMRRIIIESLDIDRFITLQNGTLVDVFFNKTRELRENDTVKYQTSQIYRQFNPELFRKICNAYENFISYLDDDNVIIDHTYLWDIVSQPNERLFKNGNNLILLHIPDDDITNNVQVICPTNAYSGEVFDANRKTVIIMKRDKYYEPIYLFESKSNGKFNVLGRFAIKSKTITPKIKHVIENIRDIYFTYCRLHASQPRQYKYVMNKPAKQVAKLLTDSGFQITSQVVNYNGKVIGFNISQTTTTTTTATKIKQTKTVPKETARKMWEGVIPTAVSAPLIAVGGAYEYPIVMMDNDDLWRNSYNETVEFLNMVADKVKKMTKQTVNCRPKVKVVEDGLIVGVLTETNQFIQVNVNVEPAQNQDDELPTITEGNHLKVDKEIMTSSSYTDGAAGSGGDKSRERYVRNIRLETNFYNVFRNTARNVLNRPENRAIKEEIDKIISSVFTIYTNKLSKVIALMKQITTKYIAFIHYSKETLKLVGEVSSCITTDHEKCGQKSYCLKEGGGLCKLLLPQRNLMYPDIDNQIAYFGKLSDEMIRYERVKLFMFEPAKYLTFQEIKYNLNDDEIILLESLITQEYFDNLEPMDANPYALQTTFYTVNPNANTGAELQRYDNTYRKSYVDGYIESTRGAAVVGNAPAAAPEPPVSVSGVERFKANEITHVLGFCNEVSKRKVTEKMRQLFFPIEDTYEILFSNESEECSFDVILTILRAVAQTASKCPSGHTCNRMKQLERRGAAGGGGGGGGGAAEEQDACGKCRTMIGKDQTEFGCLQCNYFVCDNCQHQHVDQLGSMNIIKLKEILVSEYGKIAMTPTFDKKITRVLNGYGMKKYAELITGGRATLSQVIQSQNYFLTNVDIWILALYFKLPIAFISQSLLIENGRNLMVLYGNDMLESYFFIHPFGVTQDVISRYGLIEKKLDEETSVLKIPSDYLTEGLRDMITSEIDEPKSLEQYISDFKLGDVKTKGRAKLVMRKTEDVSDRPGEQPEE